MSNATPPANGDLKWEADPDHAGYFDLLEWDRDAECWSLVGYVARDGLFVGYRYTLYYPLGSSVSIRMPEEIRTLPKAKAYVEALWRMQQ